MQRLIKKLEQLSEKTQAVCALGNGLEAGHGRSSSGDAPRGRQEDQEAKGTGLRPPTQPQSQQLCLFLLYVFTLRIKTAFEQFLNKNHGQKRPKKITDVRIILSI